MAKAENGPLGPAKGKLANMIFSTNLGTPYVRMNPGKRSKKNEKEQNTHDGFDYAWGFLNPLKPLLKLGYQEVAKRNRGVFAALSYLLKYAVERDTNNVTTIVPSKMLMSRGSLGNSTNIQVTLSPDRELLFTWDSRSDSGPYSSDDQPLLVAYNVETKKAAYSIGPAYRRDATATLPLTNLPVGNIHVYLGFISQDRTKASDSVYLGELEV